MKSVHTHSLQSVAVCSLPVVAAALAGEQPGAAVHQSQQTVPGAQQKIDAPLSGIQPGLCVQGELTNQVDWNDEHQGAGDEAKQEPSPDRVDITDLPKLQHETGRGR